MNACETYAAIVVRTPQAATDACVQLVIESLEQNVAEVCSGLKSVKINAKAIYFSYKSSISKQSTTHKS